jgi:hypothetical protein
MLLHHSAADWVFMLARFFRSPVAQRIRASSSGLSRALALGSAPTQKMLTTLLYSSLLAGGAAVAISAAPFLDFPPAHIPVFLCSALQQETGGKTPEQIAPASEDVSAEGGAVDKQQNASPVSTAAPASSSAVADSALSLAAAAAAEASASAIATAAAALDAANSVDSPVPAVDPATNAAAAAEVIHSSGIARTPSVLDPSADVVARVQQQRQLLVGEEQEVIICACVRVVSVS